MNTKSLTLATLPPFAQFETDNNRGYQIALYLERLLSAYQLSNDNRIVIPSLTDLAHFFQVSQMEVYDSFKILRKQGYDYLLSGTNEDIPFWAPEPIQERMIQSL